MYTLRSVLLSSRLTTNKLIGDQYVLVNKMLNPEEFNRFMELHSHEIHEPETVFGFVHYNKGLDYEVLFSNQAYYIVGATGKTFERLQNYNTSNEEFSEIPQVIGKWYSVSNLPQNNDRNFIVELEDGTIYLADYNSKRGFSGFNKKLAGKVYRWTSVDLL